MNEPSTSFDFKYDPYLQAAASKEEQEKEVVEEDVKTFKCYLCSMVENYIYKGRTPPFLRNIKFLEECYVIEDPFSPPGKNEYLTLGSDCSICGEPVCKGTECSFYYTRNYCKICLRTSLNSFPANVQFKIKRLFNF